ncbi:hypothetical protein [Borreliella americana]|uniref:hypothetical protein n=1 Tax=Borreliella americana TaxID=478807 RepID=UPI001E507FEE|nr:hypothetical protein [Borreliella americana]MCD2332636.1 hypothetical protein [Borreliella americana]
MKKCNKFILTSIVLLSFCLSCKLFKDLDNKSSNLEKLASSSQNNRIQDKIGLVALDDLDKDSLLQNQFESQQEIALKNELRERLSKIGHDALTDISKIDDKIASLEALQKQLEKDLSNQPQINKGENVAAKAQTHNQEEQKVHKDGNKAHAAVADLKKDAFIKETIESIKEKIEEEKKRKAILEEKQQQKQQELDQIKAQTLKYEEEKRKRKEKKARLQKFMQVTSDLTELANMAQDKTYHIIEKLEDLKKGVPDKESKDKDAIDKKDYKEELNKSLKDVIYEITKLSSLIEAKEKIDERKKLGFQSEEEFDTKFKNLKKIKGILKTLCGKAKGHLGGILSDVTIDGITKDKVGQASLIIKLIQKTLIYINDGSKDSLDSILGKLEKDVHQIK